MRVYGSISFMILQLAKMGIFLLLPALALATVTGFNVFLCIAVMGLLCTIYTVLGGIEAVVWTDVLQSIVLLGGGFLCIGLIVSAEHYDFGSMWELAVSESKFHIPRLDSSIFWTFVVGGFFIQMVPFTSDQTLMQRLLTTRNERAAARAIWAHAGIVVPASLLFFGLGTALFIFYDSRPELLPASDQNDIIVPWFIVTQLPMGLAGLVIAGIFAATMSTVDSSMHSISTSFVTDIYGKLRLTADDKTRLKVARIVTIVVGVLGCVSAILVSNYDPDSLWDLILLFMALFGSTLTGVFVLGVFTKRANALGAGIGIVASIVTLIVLRNLDESPVHGVLTAATGVLTCVAIGYLVSLVTPSARRSLAGLTFATIESTEESENVER